MLQGGCKCGWELSWLPRVAAGGEALLQAGWHSSCPAGRGHGGHAAETVPAWGYFSECQFSALSLGSGCEAERGDSPSSRAKQSETEDAWLGRARSVPRLLPKVPGQLWGHRPAGVSCHRGLRARRAPCSGGHGPSSTERYLCLHSASDPSGGRLAGQDRGREGRERTSAMPVAPWGQESPPGPTNVCAQTCRCAHGPAHTHMHRNSPHLCANTAPAHASTHTHVGTHP